MLFYLTGASSSLAKSPEAPQPDTAKSLGGYVSSSAVPNGELNSLFDLISTYTLNERKQEFIAIALINKYNTAVNNIRLSVITDIDNICRFDIAAVKLNSEYAMEHIPNRYAQPISAEFHNADFIRAYTDIKVLSPISPEEEIMLYPFNVIVRGEQESHTMDDTFYCFERAFANNDEYAISRVNETTFRITRLDNTILDEECSYLSTDGFRAEFSKNLQNGDTKNIMLIEKLEPEEGIGLWIRRSINKYKISDEQLVKRYLEKYVPTEIEQVELSVDFLKE